MILGGLQLVFLGGSFYYLVAGLLLVASAIRLWKLDPMASTIYGGLMIATVAWALLESGSNYWALAPRILPFAAIGAWFLNPWLRRALYHGNPPPLFASRISVYAVVVAVVVTAYVVVDGHGYEVSRLQPGVASTQ